MKFQTSVAGAWKKWARERTKRARETRPRARSLLRPNSFKRGLRFPGLFFLDTPATISRKRPLFRAPRRGDYNSSNRGLRKLYFRTRKLRFLSWLNLYLIHPFPRELRTVRSFYQSFVIRS